MRLREAGKVRDSNKNGSLQRSDKKMRRASPFPQSANE